MADKFARASSAAPIRVGLIGLDLDLSLSRVLHETEGAALGLNYRYDVFDGSRDPGYSDLGAGIRNARADGYRGVNVTHPFKQAAVQHVDALSADARVLGSVNTVVFDGSRATGYNTDWYGFARSIDKNLAAVPRRTVVQFGAGGAGVAVAYALLRSGVERLVLIDIDETRAADTATTLNAAHGRAAILPAPVEDAARWMRAADGVVNATPLGMPASPGSAVPVNLLQPATWVHDVVYMPLETELMAAARATGCLTVGGGHMLVFQAAEGFRLFTGIAPDEARMLSHLERIIAEGGQVSTQVG
ncbi:shikimate dehydrogenase [Glaciihabitans tibetensis]|uniref:Shikimate dehydrogenase n=1 Tax=Glaciihabitans tibetensis TaxID=1266600 RepID=A0A2T0VG49_9MICO|nr:shikimate dehydrogenase [Glaciihabitans tibetensis]PRY69171.1 shikimate dehydrogenase [Glaciihabitans tibetensis]